MNIFIKENWGKKTLIEMAKHLDIGLGDLLEIAFNLDLHTKKTPNGRRRWTQIEDDFLIKHSKELYVREASNLLYRSHYATYQRVRILGLQEMIKQK